MLKIDASVNKFINNPDRYLINVKRKNGQFWISADQKGVWTWIKARLPEWLGFGSYKLEDIHQVIKWHIKPIPEYTPLKQTLNKVIEKWERIRREKTKISFFSLEPFDSYKVKVRPNVQLTLVEIINLANQKFPNNEWCVKFIASRCTKGLLDYPELYMNQWKLQRGGTHEHRPEDNALGFFEKEVFEVTR